MRQSAWGYNNGAIVRIASGANQDINNHYYIGFAPYRTITQTSKSLHIAPPISITLAEIGNDLNKSIGDASSHCSSSLSDKWGESIRLTWISDRIKRRNNQPGSQDRNKNNELKNRNDVGSNHAKYNGYNKGDHPSAQSYSQSNRFIFLRIHSSNSPTSIRIANNNNTATTAKLFFVPPCPPFLPSRNLGRVDTNVLLAKQILW